MYDIMRVTDLDSQDVYWLDGHDESEAHDSFGSNIEIELMTASPITEETHDG